MDGDDLSSDINRKSVVAQFFARQSQVPIYILTLK